MAERKASGVLKAGARVVLVSPDVTRGLAHLRDSGRLRLVQRRYRSGDLVGAVLAFAATDRPEVNRAVAAEAQAKGILLNSPGTSATGDFIVPSVIQRGMLQIALSTGGKSPAYARMVREQLEGLFGPEHEELLELLGRLRSKVMVRFPDKGDSRRRVWKRLASRETLDLLRHHRCDEIDKMIDECLSWQ